MRRSISKERRAFFLPAGSTGRFYLDVSARNRSPNAFAGARVRPPLRIGDARNYPAALNLRCFVPMNAGELLRRQIVRSLPAVSAMRRMLDSAIIV